MVEITPGKQVDGLGNEIVLTDLTGVAQLTPDALSKLIAGITMEDIKKIIDETEKIMKDDINPMEFNIFDYQGYDPEITIRVMIAISAHSKDKPGVLLSDIKFSIAAVLMMGNLQAKSREKRSEAGRLKITYLCSKYNIQLGSTSTGIPAEVMTFPRISSAFPSLSIMMAWVLKPKFVNLDFHSGEVPEFMRLQQFNSLCSQNMSFQLSHFLMEACNCYSADMSIAFEKGKQKIALKGTGRDIKYNPADIAQDQWQFAEIAQGSKYPSEKQKKDLLLRLKVSDYYDKLLPLVKRYRSILQKIEEDKVTVLSKEDFQNDLTTYLASS